MRVSCILNNYAGLPSARQKAIAQYLRSDQGQTYLRESSIYTVYGILFRDNAPWYYIFEENKDEYPKPFPYDYFEFTSAQLDARWLMRARILNDGTIETEILPRAWAEDPSFYEKLLDDDPSAIKKMKDIKLDIE